MMAAVLEWWVGEEQPAMLTTAARTPQQSIRDDVGTGICLFPSRRSEIGRSQMFGAVVSLPLFGT